MAYIVVSPFVNNLSLFLSEATFPPGVEAQVRSLCFELEHMKEFLMHAKGKLNNVMVDQIRDVAFEAEDIVEEYVVNVARVRRRIQEGIFFRSFTMKMIIMIVGKLFPIINVEIIIKNVEMKLCCCFYREMMFHNIGERVMQLQTIYKEIKENEDKFDNQQKNVKDDEELQRLQRIRMEVEEDDVVGFGKETKKLLDQLLSGTEELDVISISGTGGLGKTTLARKVYKHPYVKKRFTCRAWASVSQNFNLTELLLKILKGVSLITEKISEMEEEQLEWTKDEISEMEEEQLEYLTKDKILDMEEEQLERTTDKISEMKEEELKEEVKKQLSQHRYLVVLDDIWSIQNWDELKKVFPNDKIGSRVFITTRIKNVAFHASRNPPLELRFLDDNESCELFRDKVFRGGPCPTNLKLLEKEIVAKCAGLPAAIVGLGGLLAREEKTYHTWKRMVVGFSRNIAQETRCLDILGLSYNDLPLYLQPCFLYFGLFPKDYKINGRQLIQLWISEGFIQHEDDETLKKEDVGEIYLQQLIDRSLIQVEDRRSDGGVKTCRLHNLIHDLCLELSKKEKFLESHSTVSSSQTKPRRLSLHCSCRDYILKAKPSDICHARSLICFNQDKSEFSEEHCKLLFERFKLLRVLDLGDGEADKLPKAIRKLILLKYLKVKAVDINGVPSSIFALDNLQTLDLRSSGIDLLPKQIWCMQQLRHLYLDGPSKLPKNAGGKCLPNLLTLCYVSKNPNGRVHIAEKAPNLTKLGLFGYHCDSPDEQRSTFGLCYLQSLKLTNKCIFDVQIKLPQTITKISIKMAFLDPVTIKTFQMLSELRILKFDVTSFDNDELVFEEDWFSELQLLKIENSNIAKWKLQEGAVPKLERVVISNCHVLEMLPEGLWALPKLEKLELLWLPKKLNDSIGTFKKNSQLEVVIEPATPSHSAAVASTSASWPSN